MKCMLARCKRVSRNKREPGYCKVHYQRLKKHGNPLESLPIRKQKGNRAFENAKVRSRERSKIKKSYWAGFFDGEGSVGVYKSKNHFNYRCTISQKKPFEEVIEEIAKAYDGSVYYNAGGCANMQLSSVRAYEFLRDVFPYLRIKKPQVKLFLEAAEELMAGRDVDHESIVSEISLLKKEK